MHKQCIANIKHHKPDFKFDPSGRSTSGGLEHTSMATPLVLNDFCVVCPFCVWFSSWLPIIISWLFFDCIVIIPLQFFHLWDSYVPFISLSRVISKPALFMYSLFPVVYTVLSLGETCSVWSWPGWQMVSWCEGKQCISVIQCILRFPLFDSLEWNFAGGIRYDFNPPPVKVCLTELEINGRWT